MLSSTVCPAHRLARVTFSPNLKMSGYNSWLTTCALWRRIVDLMRKPSVALLDWCQGGIRRLGLRDRDNWHDRAGRVQSPPRDPHTQQPQGADRQQRRGDRGAITDSGLRFAGNPAGHNDQ